MKTYHIKDLLKKEILIIEIPEGAYYEIFKNGLYIKDDDGERDFIEGSYTLLGKPDEIKESDARELVHSFLSTKKTTHYQDYDCINACYDTAVESFFSAIESEIYWENPYREKIFVNMDISASMVRAANREIYSEKYHEAELRTFEKSRTLIFVKN